MSNLKTILLLILIFSLRSLSSQNKNDSLKPSQCDTPAFKVNRSQAIGISLQHLNKQSGLNIQSKCIQEGGSCFWQVELTEHKTRPGKLKFLAVSWFYTIDAQNGKIIKRS